MASIASWGKGFDYKASAFVTSDTPISWSTIEEGDYAVLVFAADANLDDTISFSRGGSTWSTSYDCVDGPTANNSGNVAVGIYYKRIDSTIYSAIQNTGTSDDVYIRTWSNWSGC